MRTLLHVVTLSLVCIGAIGAVDTGWVTPNTHALFSEQGFSVGTAYVWNDRGSIKVRLLTVNGWQIEQVQIAVTDTVDEVPLDAGGRPLVDQFAFQQSWDPETSDVVVTAAAFAQDFDATEQKVVTVYATVNLAGANQTGVWALEHFFPGTFTMYTSYDTKAWWPPFNLPDGPITLNTEHPGPASYWHHTLSNVPADCDLSNGVFPAWCVDKDATMKENHDYAATVYNPFAPGLPDRHAGKRWDLVNYAMNHGAGLAWEDIQDVMWVALDQMPAADLSPAAATYWTQVQANGGGYVPGPDEQPALITDVGAPQITIFAPDMDAFWENHEQDSNG